MPARYTSHFTAPGRVPLEIPTSTGRAPVTFSENQDKSPLIAGRAPAGTRQDSGKVSVMPRSHFTKGAFPSSSRAVFWPSRTATVWTPTGAVHFFTPRGPRVTFNFKGKHAGYTRLDPLRDSEGSLFGP